uniref:Uncharacterized protein n=1 Tax=Candidatus Kentrum sp. DK TaxID=2126562 RepID=A0A450TLF4_9GAMM|nr:MAG: hypothetical protein BECKDK2373B_GA0170837_12142 [Candidatus Kentron sp. DK]
MKDEIMQELWRAKDTIAARHHYDVRRLVEHLNSMEKPPEAGIVDLHAKRMRDPRPAVSDFAESTPGITNQGRAGY